MEKIILMVANLKKLHEQELLDRNTKKVFFGIFNMSHIHIFSLIIFIFVSPFLYALNHLFLFIVSAVFIGSLLPLAYSKKDVLWINILCYLSGSFVFSGFLYFTLLDEIGKPISGITITLSWVSVLLFIVAWIGTRDLTKNIYNFFTKKANKTS